MDTVFFYIFTGLTLISALCVISFRNTLSSAVSLVVCFFGLAGLFALLQAHLLAALQILVYAGAIMVLFLFVIMLLNLGQKEISRVKMAFLPVVGILLGVYLIAILVLDFKNIPVSFPPLTIDDFGSIKTVGRTLFTQYLIPFEIISILLLIGVVGVVSVAKYDREEGTP